jgi:hypothetical protein
MWGKRNPFTLLVGMQTSTTTLENNMEASLKTKHRSAIWSSNPTPRDIPKGMWHRLLHRYLHTHVYCSAIHNSQVMETAKMPHTDEWIKKMWHLCTMEFYSAMRKNEILSFVSKWMELENIILIKVSQAQKTKNCIFSLICKL